LIRWRAAPVDRLRAASYSAASRRPPMGMAGEAE